MTRIPPARLARQVAHAAATFEHRLLGRGPTSVSVVAGRDWMVVSLHERLSPVECRIAVASHGAERVRRFHRAVFDGTLEALVEHVGQVTGVALRSGVVDVDATSGSVLKTLTTQPDVDLFLLGQGFPALGVPVNARVRATVAGLTAHGAADGTLDPACGRQRIIGVAEFNASDTQGFDASGGTGAARA